MQDYFRGPLIEYYLSYPNQRSSDAINDYKQFIYITQPVVVKSTTNIYYPQGSPYTEPFSRSTVLLELNEGTQIYLYLLDRNFVFYQYDATNYSSGILSLKAKA